MTCQHTSAGGGVKAHQPSPGWVRGSGGTQPAWDGQPRELGGMKVTNIRPTVKPDIAPAKQMQTNDAKRYPQKSVVPG